MEDLLERRRMLMSQQESVDPYLLQPFTITVTTSSTQIYVRSTGTSNPSEVTGLLTSVFFNKNNTGWQEFTYDVDEGLFVSNGSYAVPVEAGDVVQVKGNGPWTKSNAKLAFNVVGTNNRTDARFDLSGNIMSLLYSDNFETATVVPTGGLAEIFHAGQLAPIQYCIVDASKLRLPATEVGNGGYRYMFNQCVNMTSAPEIISVMTMGTYACHQMFYNCVHLVNPPKELPAINMTNSCYNQMFRNCSRMLTAPDIPNVNWGTATNPMNGMFRGCSSLSKIKAMFTELPSDRTVINGWLNGVDTSGIFIKNINATWNVTGDSGVPSGWTIQYASS